MIGTLILMFGWMGFNPGSTLGATDLRIGLVAVNTLLAGCVGFVMAMGTTNYKYGKPDISMSCNGMLAGLVAITAPCAFVAPWAAVIIGAVAGVLVVYSVEFWDRRHIDDPCGAISVHGVNGAWGVLAVGLFADGTYGQGWNGAKINNTTACKGCSTVTPGSSSPRCFHVVVGFAWAWGSMWLIFAVVKRFIQIRVSPEVEIQGLDVPEFGALAYPDFVLTSTHVGGHASVTSAAPKPAASDPGRTS